ncbi:MAG: hypothetical protein QMD77_00060 [Patescibacteria group bacterium]|nr:hypothetical protein [Patescibacteria group bacterium]
MSAYEGHIEIEGGLGYVRFAGRLSATGYIFAEAGSGIEAGEGIKAGSGIEAGLFITCKLALSISYRIFAGVAVWKKEPTEDEKTITCGKLEKGKVEYGTLKEIGLPDEEAKNECEDSAEIIELNGKKYKRID